MKLWTVADIGHAQRAIMEDGIAIVLIRSTKRGQQICDEHNAWEILHHRHFTLGRVHDLYFVEGVEMAFKDKLKDTPVAAILAADSWLREKEK